MLRTRKIYQDSLRTLIAVESVDIQHSITNTGGHLIGNIKPIAVIVQSPEGICAFDMEAKPANMDQLIQELPELDFLK